MEQNINPKVLGALLHGIHFHDSEGNIIYSEKDLIKVLKGLGLPEPEWGESYSIEEYEQRRKATKSKDVFY